MFKTAKRTQASRAWDELLELEKKPHKSRHDKRIMKHLKGIVKGERGC